MTTPARFQLINDLFRAAVERTGDEQRAFLDHNCADDPALLKILLAMLREDKRADSPLDHALIKSTVIRGLIPSASSADAAPMPEMIGHYRILRELGRGGMGIVYEAVQENPQRTVALKVINAGLGSHGLLRRFEREAAALGRLQHRGIAHIHEAGSFESNGQTRPFLAMEFVRGEPLQEYAAERSFDVRERLSLIARICDAIEHAHRQGVIHRDLKPSNILVVDEDPSASDVERVRGEHIIGQPKILDFGVARLTDSNVPSYTTHTNAGQLIGTVQYMSPEQAAGDIEHVDARSDIYSLGVVAYELIAGRLPHLLHDKLVHEALRIIREDDPTPLSSINRLYRGDVETIIAKTIDKDPARRYQSAAALAIDIRRYLADQPIAARPPSTLYQIRKFARRNRSLVTSVAAGFVLMLIGLVLSLREAHNARAAQHIAEQRTAEATRQTVRATLAAAIMEMHAGEAAEASHRLAEIEPENRNFEWHYVNAGLDDSIARIEDDSPIVGAHLTPDGSEVLTLSATGMLKRWEARSATLRSASLLCAAPVVRAAFSADGSRIAAVVEADGMRLWAWDGAESASIDLGAIAGRPRRIEVDPSGRWIALAIRASGFDLFDADTRSHRLIETQATVQDLVFTAQARLASTTGGTAQVLDCHGDSPLQNVFYHNSGISLGCSPDGTMLLTGGQDKAVHLVEVGSGNSVATLIGHVGAVQAVRFVPNTPLAVTIGQEQVIGVWNLETRRMVKRFFRPDASNAAPIFAADGATFITRSNDGVVNVWDVNNDRENQQVLRHDGYVYAIAFTPDGSRIVSGAWDETIRIWDARTGALLSTLPSEHGYVSAVAVSPDGSMIASGQFKQGGGRSVVQLWDAQTGQVLHHLTGGLGKVTSITFSPDGRRFACTRTHTATMISRTDSVDAAPLTLALDDLDPPDQWREDRFVLAGAWSPDGRWLATAYGSGFVRIWRAEDRSLVHELSGHSGDCRNLAFSADSRLLASASDDATARLWDVGTGQCLAVLRGHGDCVYAVAFTPDGTRIATGSRDASVRLWEVSSGKELLLLRGHADYVHALAFSPDGSQLASGSGDNTIRLWRTYPPHASPQAPNTKQ